MDINNFVVTPKQMKILENASHCAGVSLSMLMDNAGRSLAEKILNILQDNRYINKVYILAGNGNNAGDGFVCAQILSNNALSVKVIMLCGDAKTELSKAAYSKINGIDVTSDYENIDFTDCLVSDCVFGTGFHGELPENVTALFNTINNSTCIKVACDIPSGASALDGYCSNGTLDCDYTVTFGAIKTGMLLSPCREACGKIIVADIDIPKQEYIKIEKPVIKLDNDYIKKLIPIRKATSHKGDFGKLINICGSKNYTGAAALSSLSALRSGVGICTVASPTSVTSIIGGAVFEATYLPLEEDENGQISFSNYDVLAENIKCASAVLIGCGLGVSDDIKKLVEKIILNAECPLIIDADGINAILDRIDILKNTKASIILTPHPGELARLLNISTKEVLKERVRLASEFSEKYRVTLVSKGSGTVIATPDGSLYFSTAGNPGLSRGGSGDVLAGMIASFSAQGLSPEAAACAGVFLHGTTADIVAEKISVQGMLPSDIIKELPLVFKAIDR